MEDQETQGEQAFLLGLGYDVKKGELWCLGWAREQSRHEAAIARRTSYEDSQNGTFVGCGVNNCLVCER